MNKELERRVEAAAKAAHAEVEQIIRETGMYGSLPIRLGPIAASNHRVLAAAVRAYFPELFTDPPTAWLAPMEATEAMEDAHFAAHARAKNVFADVPTIWDAMRDAHLTTTGGSND